MDIAAAIRTQGAFRCYPSYSLRLDGAATTAAVGIKVIFIFFARKEASYNDSSFVPSASEHLYQVSSTVRFNGPGRQ